MHVHIITKHQIKSLIDTEIRKVSSHFFKIINRMRTRILDLEMKGGRNGKNKI